MNRREWLRGSAATVAASTFALSSAGLHASEDPDLRAKARKNFKLGIMSSVYADLPVEVAARQIRADGFGCVVCDFAFADIHFNPLEPDWSAARKAVTALERAGIELVSLFGYYNVVDPDVNRRKLGAARIEALLAAGDQLGCRVVSTETGTFNSHSEWESAPENQTEQGYLQCRAVLEAHAAPGREAWCGAGH